MSSIQAEIAAHRQRMMAPIDRRIAELTAEIEKLSSIKSSLGGSATAAARRGRPPGSNAASSSNGKATVPAKTGRKGKRQRRSRGDVEKHANDILEFVKSSKNGVTGTQIKDKFGKIIGTVKNYVKQYTGAELVSAGPKTSMKYTVK